MYKIIVVGAQGKMGKLVCESLKNEGYVVIEVDQKQQQLRNLSDVDQKADLVIDFSNKDQSLDILNYCEKHLINLIMGTTGQGEFFMSQMKMASEKIAIMKCDNFSENIVKFRRMCSHFSKNFEGEIAVVESHHKNKVDVPSGTAKSIVSAILNQQNNKSGISLCGTNFDNEIINCYSLRGGTLFGRHEVHFLTDDEEIILTHTSYSRKPFINGLLKTVKFFETITKPGLYQFDEIL